MQVHLVTKSLNKKTGNMPQSYQASSSCPTSCPHKDKGCYARFSYTAMIWNKVDSNKLGKKWEDFLDDVKSMNANLWRYGVAGDLPGDGDNIDQGMMADLVAANGGKQVISYTHKPLTPENMAAIDKANRNGFTVNLSADTLEEADRYYRTGIGPVVITMPKDPKDWPKETPNGVRIIPCPADTHSKTCVECRLCAKAGRRTIIGFAAHGTGKRYVEEHFNGQ